MNLNKKILSLVITTCAFNITNSSYCMNNNEFNDKKLTNDKDVLQDINYFLHDNNASKDLGIISDPQHNGKLACLQCSNTISKMCYKICNTIYDNIIDPKTNGNSSNEIIVSFSKVQEILKIFNFDLVKNSYQNGNPILMDEYLGESKEYENKTISLKQYCEIINACIRLLSDKTENYLDQSFYSSKKDLKKINKENADITYKAYEIMKNAYDNYSIVLSNLLNDKAKNINDTIQEELNKLNNLFYYGSTFQKRFDKLHRLLLSAFYIILEDIDNNKVENITIHRNASLGNNDNYESIMIFNEQNGEYDYYKSTAFSEYVFPKDEVSLNEYLNGLKKYLSVRKNTVDTNIQKVINKNYILTEDDIKFIINNAYLRPIYWLIRAMNYEKNYVEGTTLPIICTYIINEFAKYYGLAPQYWPPLPDDLEKDIKNNNIRFDKLLDK